MKSDPAVYAYRMPENLSVDHGEFNGDILASKTIDIQLEGRTIPGAIVFMRMPKADLKAALHDKSSGIHSSKETREHFRKLLASRGNPPEIIDKVLTEIDKDYSDNGGSEQHIRQKHKKSAFPYAARLSVSAEKLRQILPKHTSRSEKEKPVLARAFEVVTEKAIHAGIVRRVDENGVAYTDSAEKNKRGESVHAASAKAPSEKSTDVLPNRQVRHSITRKAHIRPDNPALRQGLQKTSSTVAAAPVTVSADDSDRQTSGPNSGGAVGPTRD